jgi:DNA replication licensing factor MCM2
MAAWLADAPTEMLKIFDEVAYSVVLEMFPEYKKICAEVHVRITDLPINDSLRSLRFVIVIVSFAYDLRQLHLNCFVKVSGVVTRRTSVFPQLKYVKYDCGKCGFILGPYYQDNSVSTETKIGSCPQCQSKGPFSVNAEQVDIIALVQLTCL